MRNFGIVSIDFLLLLLLQLKSRIARELSSLWEKGRWWRLDLQLLHLGVGLVVFSSRVRKGIGILGIVFRVEFERVSDFSVLFFESSSTGIGYSGIVFRVEFEWISDI